MTSRARVAADTRRERVTRGDEREKCKNPEANTRVRTSGEKKKERERESERRKKRGKCTGVCM